MRENKGKKSNFQWKNREAKQNKQKSDLKI